MENKIRYQVVTTDSFQIIADGFYTEEGAWGWASAHDYGQFENDGGLRVIEYELE